jgi:hypothetical protein
MPLKSFHLTFDFFLDFFCGTRGFGLPRFTTC